MKSCRREKLKRITKRYLIKIINSLSQLLKLLNSSSIQFRFCLLDFFKKKHEILKKIKTLSKDLESLFKLFEGFFHLEVRKFCFACSPYFNVYSWFTNFFFSSTSNDNHKIITVKIYYTYLITRKKET